MTHHQIRVHQIPTAAAVIDWRGRESLSTLVEYVGLWLHSSAASLAGFVLFWEAQQYSIACAASLSILVRSVTLFGGLVSNTILLFVHVHATFCALACSNVA